MAGAQGNGAAPPKVAPNPQRGEVAVEIGGELHFASVNYERAAQLIALFRDPEGGGVDCNWGQGALQAWLAGDLDRISAALAIVTGLSVQEVYEASPPWEEAQAVLKNCYNLFFFGALEAPEEPEQEVGKAADPLAQSAATRIWNFWRRPARQPSQQGSSPASSGQAPSTRSGSSFERGQNAA